MIMENEIIVYVDWDQNFGAVSDIIPGCVATGKTYDKVVDEYKKALDFHLNGLDEVPKELKDKNYVLVFKPTIQAFLHRYDGILTRAGLSRLTGINERQMGHYLSGHRKPSLKTRTKIIEKVHELGSDLINVV